ncbi:fatty-acid amide hydrolase 1 [Sphaeramia orbicularis]|uniref:Fatty-acid amide hydrolase 1 n=1 Tax=Sphaeramia orbicularis TaxID=375764 RepID=A0A672YJY9_9TELE|nr:fatty-acid amide hydrolase 1 [Sphaeramia orbicularis]
MELDKRTAALLTAAACGVGAVVVLVQKVSRHQEAKKRIQKATNLRTESLRRAEQEVLRYKQSHPATSSANILMLSLSELTKQLKDGSLSPEDVFYTYMEKAIDVHKKLNCCTGIILESFEQLKTIHSSKEGLLYGVPVSIKENFDCQNHYTSCGVVINLDQPIQEDSVLVKVLKSQGAIPFVKTNLPQALLNYDCSNPIYGQTVNPHNLQKTSGGSSGGEGALLGGGGSVLGLGSDIGGSIRFPASFCGVCGLKPTAGRLSSKGLKTILPGQKSVLSCPGPMAKDVDSLALFMQAVLCDHMFSLDPTIPPVPFNVQMYQSRKPLRIGYLENDGYTQPSPSMLRGIREVKALLERAGHTLVPYKPPRIKYALHELIVRGVLADGGATMLQKLKGSPVDPALIEQVKPYYLPKWIKKTMSFLLSPVSPRVPAVLSAICGFRSIPELWKQHAAVEDYIHETIAEWRRLDIDVLLCPMLGPAFNFFYCSRLTCAVSYTMIYNLLNFPAGCLPVSTVTEQDEEELRHYKGNYQDMWDRHFKKAVTGSVGLPVAVQCVALPWHDELCLRFMKEVEELVKESRK